MGAFKYSGYVNPLAFLAAELPWSHLFDRKATDDDLRGFLCTPGLDSSLEGYLIRFSQISSVAPRLPVVPSEKRILERLVWPLRHARSSYALGNYLGTIALCGLVGEMLTIILFDMSLVAGMQPSVVPNAPSTIEAFEKLRQVDRISFLRKLGWAEEKILQSLTELRIMRGRYLHHLSSPHDEAANDACLAFGAAVTALASIFVRGFSDGMVVMDDRVPAYLERLQNTSKM